jgi:drug/metabolite transporter (DMT)-like permease
MGCFSLCRLGRSYFYWRRGESCRRRDRRLSGDFGAATPLRRLPGSGCRRGGDLGAFFVMGLTNNVIPFSLISWANVPSGFAAILNATTPIFAVILANVLTVDEKMTPGRLAGVIIGFIGVAVMIGPDALAGATDNLLADLALLVASVFYAFSPISAAASAGRPHADGRGPASSRRRP